VPYDTVITNPTGSTAAGTVALPTLSSTAGDGTQVANYEGVIVATSGAENMSDAQWSTLQTFEHQFSVRQISAYVYPSSDYGLNTPTFSGNLSPSNAPLTLTADGGTVFPYLKSAALDPSTCGSTSCQYGYEATVASGANVDTLVSGPGSSSMVGIYTSSDDRQTMFQTFDQNQYELQSQLLRHGELAWLTRQTYFGFQRNYLETDVDDNFLSDDSWSIAGNATTAPHTTDYDPADALREVPADVTQAASWSRSNNFRIDMLFNGGGSVAVADGDSLVGAGDGGSGGTGSTGTSGGTGTGTDPLLAAFTGTDPATGKPYTDDFGWISHTWDHPNIDEGCATQNYIEAELNQNNTWGTTAASGGNPLTAGLGLTASTDPTDALGNDNPQVVITGEHSGLANLLPGNPGQVDPPSLDTVAIGAAAGTFGAAGDAAAGEYVYGVTDEFNSAAPGATPVDGTGQSAASVSDPVTVAAGQSVDLTWGAVCHAGNYIVYRAPYTAPVAPATVGTIGAWTELGSVAANTTTDFTNPTGNSTTNTAGGGAIEKSFTDTGAAGTATGSTGEPTATSIPASEGAAVESAYEQNPVLDAAFAAIDGGKGIKYFGADASKPYPVPGDTSFATGSYTGAEATSGATFSDAGATGIPRYPTNIYYNVSTNAQEVDEYETLYDSPTCTPIAGVTTCNPAGTAFTIGDIVASVDSGMFSHMMGNDPRPTYFHQTNLMSQTTGTVNGEGDGLFYETVNPLLTEYNQYFNSSAPIEQPTMAAIGALLTEQAAWATAAGNTVTGAIEGNQVTVDNAGTGAIEVPLSGTTGGTSYAGINSYWTSVNPGTSTFTAVNTWPALPTTPVAVTVPTGPAPSTGGTKMPTAPKPPASPTSTGGRSVAVSYVAYQTTPKTVKLSKKGKVTVSLTCKATRGKTAKGKTCAGTFTLTVAGQKLSHSFKFKSGKVDRITLTLKSKVRTAVITAARRNARPHARHKKPAQVNGKLVITTKLSAKTHQTTKGTLTIKT
jgi:hypothetical protein